MHQVQKKKQGRDYTRLVMHTPKLWYEHLVVDSKSGWDLPMVVFLVGEAGVQNGHVNMVGDRISSCFHCDKVLKMEKIKPKRNIKIQKSWEREFSIAIKKRIRLKKGMMGCYSILIDNRVMHDL